MRAYLLENGIPPGKPMPRKAWNTWVARLTGLGIEQVNGITQSGALLGTWTIINHVGPKAGAIALKPLEEPLQGQPQA